MDKKRALSSDCQEVRLAYAREQLQEKNKTHTPTDRQYEYLLCFNCISNGFPTLNYKHGQVIHRRDKLKEHYKNHHPTDVPQEWSLTSESNAPPKKQAKLNYSVQSTCDKSSEKRPSNSFHVPPQHSEYQSEPEKHLQTLQNDSENDETIFSDVDAVPKPDKCVMQEESHDEAESSSLFFTKVYNCVNFIKTKDV